MKKIALLVISLVLVFSLSSVFATKEEQILIAPSPEIEVSGNVEDTEATVNEVISGELVDEAISGELDNEAVLEEEVISGEENEGIEVEPNEVDTTTTSEETNTTTGTTTTSSNSGSVVGAIIAVVIVIAVVAIAAILRKD